MERKLRVEHPAAICRVVNRGDRPKPIFKDDTERHCLVETLEERTKGDPEKITLARSG